MFQNISISRLYKQFSRNGQNLDHSAVRKNFRIYRFEARDLESYIKLLREKFNPIAYGRGGGEILSHTTIVLAVTLKPLKLWLPNFVTSCFHLFATIWENFSKIDLPGGCYSHFSNESL